MWSKIIASFLVYIEGLSTRSKIWFTLGLNYCSYMENSHANRRANTCQKKKRQNENGFSLPNKNPLKSCEFIQGKFTRFSCLIHQIFMAKTKGIFRGSTINKGMKMLWKIHNQWPMKCFLWLVLWHFHGLK